ncbi:MAG: mechanosensitive ion channel protein MscS [Magnetovibrio sp.]|nr:mechanosensitive ion channel protein MscS [Magnetovibrio sp.]
MQDFDKFWLLVIEVWREGFAGVDVGRLLTALGILLIFMMARGVFSRYVMGRVVSMAQRTANRLDDKMAEALGPPLRMVPLVLGIFFATQHLQLQGIYAEIAENVIRSLIVANVFWAVHRIIGPWSFLLDQLERVFTHELVDWMVKAIRVAILLVGAATILQIWGIQVGPIIAGAGLFGVAVALGAQDLFKNLIAGILILAEKRFRRGDWILVEGTVEGTVENIGFRSTMIRRFDKAPVMVPNAKLSDTAVVNFSSMSHRRIFWRIGVEYRTSIAQLRQIRDGIEAYILNSEDFADPPEVPIFVRIDRFNDSSIDMLIYCFTRTTEWGRWLEIKERLACAIMEIVESSGSAFAFPSQSVYVENLPVDQPADLQPSKLADLGNTP